MENFNLFGEIQEDKKPICCLISQDSRDMARVENYHSNPVLYMERIFDSALTNNKRIKSASVKLLTDDGIKYTFDFIDNEQKDNIHNSMDVNLDGLYLLIRQGYFYFVHNNAPGEYMDFNDVLIKENRCEVCNIPCEDDICDTCQDTHTSCCYCNSRVHNDDTIWHNDEVYCQSCADRYLITCDHCGDYENRGDHYTIANGNYICQSCYESHYFTCDTCNETYHNDSYGENGNCESCHEEQCTPRIHDYSYDPPQFNFHGSNNMSDLFFGMEIEVESTNDRDDLFDKINSHDEDESIYYCKHDGSLNHGIEIVTHPGTLSYWMTDETLSTMLDNIKGYAKSHDTSTCGLHIHVSRQGMERNSIYSRDEIENRIIYLYEKHFHKFLKFSRRNIDSLNRWAGRYLDDIDPVDIDKIKKNKGYGSRYKAINVQNYHTIEFRFFRGTINHNTIMASLQLVNNVVRIAMDSAYDDIDSISWEQIINFTDCTYIQEYKHNGIKGE